MSDQIITDRNTILTAITDIRAYLTATDKNSEWITIPALRDESYIPRDRFNAALTSLFRDGSIHLIPEENQKTLTRTDRYNALYLFETDTLYSYVQS